MDPALRSDRTSRLKKRFLDVLSGSVKLDPRGATLFLQGLCAQDDPVACLNAITGSPYGVFSVQSAMGFDLSVQFMNGLGSTVLEYLLRASDVGGDALDNLLYHVMEPPIFWSVFVQSFQQDALSEDAQLVFARLLSRLLTLQDQDTTPYRNIAAQPSIQDTLVASSKQEIREAGHLIKHILSSAGLVTVSGVLTGPGGRHDNDFVDYCEISILPTADEILCKKPPFLRAALHDELSTSETPIKDFLDNTFRMLREDMLFEIREGVEVALQKGKRRGPGAVYDVSMVGIHTGADNRKIRWGVELQCSEDFKQLKKMDEEAARLKFLARDPRGSKILKHQSLVCLVSEGIISFGAVNRVEELLARNPPVIVVQLDGAVNMSKTLTYLCTGKDVRLIQIDAATFSFEPVLSALQKMSSSVPITREIILWNPETPIGAPRNAAALSHIAKVVTSNLSVDLKGLLDLPTSIRLDASQAKSLIAGLTQRVSLIQGPPGTGKSFIGTILAKAIHDSTSHTILVVCYTNHALDQFLGDLLKYGIPDNSIVRLGGRSNEAMEHLSLRKQPRPRVRYDFGTIKAAASKHEKRLRTHVRELLDVDESRLMDYLEQEHHEFFQAFYVPPTTEDGMTLVGEGGRAIDEGYLFSRWTRGLDAGVLAFESHVQTSESVRIWDMVPSARQESLARWRQEVTTKIVESICQAGLAYNETQDALKEELGKSTVELLRQKRVIACTTTGAAINSQAIKEVGPNFLLVEEAGEILEGHVLTALSDRVDQMILIGDHKQLRPKVNNYQLTVEKGEGFELNRSLFERLVLKGYPHETLSTQHRMRPEISAFVRELTYPELIDAPSTRQRADIRGVQSNIVFIDHTHPEDDDSLIRDRSDGGTKTSKQNTYEVQMVLKIVRYLAQQGYKSENIVVLTPYLGQLNHLRNALKSDNDPILNDLDSLELAHAGLPVAAQPDLKAKKTRIHLATIDNYQGEESDIVIMSLTRSNKSNTIGFMDSPERLNVLLSRARDCLILIGNSHTFLRSKRGGALWRRFFTLLEKGQYVFQGFPVKCESHPQRAILLKRAGDFDDHCPDGGCMEPCGFTLSCGHVCPMMCHPDRSSALSGLHDQSRCKYEMRARCQVDRHTITWECRADRPSSCSACIKEAERLEKIAQREREAQKRREEAEVEHHRQMAELEARLEVEKAAEQRRVEEEREARAQEELRMLEEEARKAQEEVRKRQEEALKTREEEIRKDEEERKRYCEEALRQLEQFRLEQRSAEALGQVQELAATRRREELVAERLREDARASAVARAKEYEAERTMMARESEREEERRRLHQDALQRIEQHRAEEREAENERREQPLAATTRREELIAERLREDARALAVARAKEYEAERRRLHQDTLKRIEQHQAEECEAENERQEQLLATARREEERQRENARALAVARAKEYEADRTRMARESEREEERRRLHQDAVRKIEQRRAEECEAEKERQEQLLAAARREELIAKRQRENARALAVARAKEYEAERTRMVREAEREEERRRLHQDAVRKIEQRRAEAENERQEQLLAASKRREKLIAERQREYVRAEAVARARGYVAERTVTTKDSEASSWNCAIQ